MGYLLKDGTADYIGSSILEMIGGGSPISPPIARYLLRRFRAGDPAPTDPVPTGEPAPRLSEREREVLMLIVKGFSYAEIANLLGVSAHTVTTHVRGIYKKLAVHSRARRSGAGPGPREARRLIVGSGLAGQPQPYDRPPRSDHAAVPPVRAARRAMFTSPRPRGPSGDPDRRRRPRRDPRRPSSPGASRSARHGARAGVLHDVRHRLLHHAHGLQRHLGAEAGDGGQVRHLPGEAQPVAREPRLEPAPHRAEHRRQVLLRRLERIDHQPQILERAADGFRDRVAGGIAGLDERERRTSWPPTPSCTSRMRRARSSATARSRSSAAGRA